MIINWTRRVNTHDCCLFTRSVSHPSRSAQHVVENIRVEIKKHLGNSLLWYILFIEKYLSLTTRLKNKLP